METNRLTSFDLVINIRLTGTIISHEDNGEMRNFLILFFAQRNCLRNFIFDVGGNFFSIDECVR